MLYQGWVLSPTSVSDSKKVEYILQLRHHTRRGPDPLYQLAASQYLDLVEYWQEQYRQVQEECNQLRSLNVKLERSNHLLASRGHEASELLPPNPKRRKAAASSARPPKRARASQENTAEQAFAETQGVIDSDSDFLDTLGEGKLACYSALLPTDISRWSTSDRSTIYYPPSMPNHESRRRCALPEPCPHLLYVG